MSQEFPFSIGADPEFNLILQNRKVDAQQTMKIALNGKKQLKPVNMGFQVENHGDFGWDGNAATAEIRPKPAKTPQAVVAHLKGILKAVGGHLRLFDISTLSEFGPIGGHLHFEVPKGEDWSDEKRLTLHRKMASFYLPLLLTENKISLNLRLRQGYGSLKDNRVEQRFTYPDGAVGYTYEFRCPSAEWMTTPKLATATIAYLAVIYHEILHRPRTFAKCRDVLYKNDKQGDALQTLAILEFDLLTKQMMKRIKGYLQHFEMYPHYRQEIDYLFQPKKVLQDKMAAQYNLNLGWGLTDKQRAPKKKDILASKKKFRQVAAGQNLDEIKKVMNIQANEDTNVPLFVETLKDRIAAFNWRLKNNYYVFGVRKGLDAIVARNLQGDFLAGYQLVKTACDLSSLANLFDRMEEKFQLYDSRWRLAATLLDFRTGKTKNLLTTAILIGLPYDLRVKENVKPFLELIWNLEKDHLPPAAPAVKKLVDDRRLPDSEKGLVYQVLNNLQPTAQPPVVFASPNSTHENALTQLTQEVTRQTAAEMSELPTNPQTN